MSSNSRFVEEAGVLWFTISLGAAAQVVINERCQVPHKNCISSTLKDSLQSLMILFVETKSLAWTARLTKPNSWGHRTIWCVFLNRFPARNISSRPAKKSPSNPCKKKHIGPVNFCQWPKMAQYGPNMTPGVPKWPKMTQNDKKDTQNDPKWPQMT